MGVWCFFPLLKMMSHLGSPFAEVTPSSRRFPGTPSMPSMMIDCERRWFSAELSKLQWCKSHIFAQLHLLVSEPVYMSLLLVLNHHLSSLSIIMPIKFHSFTVIDHGSYPTVMLTNESRSQLGAPSLCKSARPKTNP